MGSGGNLLVMADALLETIDIRGPCVHSWQELWSIEAPEGLLRHLQQCPDDGGGRLHLLEPFGCPGAQPRRGKRGFHDVGGPQMTPMFAGELGEGDQALPIVCQAL